jgi:hypothetical protein
MHVVELEIRSSAQFMVWIIFDLERTEREEPAVACTIRKRYQEKRITCKQYEKGQGPFCLCAPWWEQVLTAFKSCSSNLNRRSRSSWNHVAHKPIVALDMFSCPYPALPKRRLRRGKEGRKMAEKSGRPGLVAPASKGSTACHYVRSTWARSTRRRTGVRGKEGKLVSLASTS